MRVLKWLGFIVAGLALLGVVLVALNWTKIQRLMNVNSLFDADKIVANFSNMDAAFLHHDLTIGEASPWPEDIQPLPEIVTLNGEDVALSEALTELDTTALVIIGDGTLIHESYYKGTDKDDLRISWSVAKSFMSGLYGQAIEDGLMDISQPIETYLPELIGTAYEGATVENILNMSSGVRFNEDYMDPKSDINDMGRVLGLGGSMDAYTETLKERQYEPGTVWQYVSIDTHVAAMALRRVTGKSLHELWNETYGANLGMGRAPFYLTDGEDVAFALGGLNLRTRDYAKFGQLFLQGGAWEGEQIIPAEWVAASTQNHAPNVHPERGTGYGYQWWVPMPQEGPHQGDFFAVGIYGQYIYVSPRHNIVIAKNAADREFTQAQSNGQGSMNMNVDLFRSLAETLAVLPEPKSEIYDVIALGGDFEGDFGEVFGLARSTDGSQLDEAEVAKYIEAFRNGQIELCNKSHCDALPSSEELEEIWSRMLEDLKPNPELQSVDRLSSDSVEYTADCVELDRWKCTLTKNKNGEISKRDVSELVEGSLAYVGIDDGYDRVEVIDITVDAYEGDRVLVALQSNVWKQGKRYKGRDELLIIDGVIQEQ